MFSLYLYLHLLLFTHKQSFIDILENSCSLKFRNIHRKITVLESLANFYLSILKNIYELLPEAATRGVLYKKVFLQISQNSQENTCARVSFLKKLQP